ncbi:hypothetical protein HPB47_002520 [Ixodes persulcatus]|uniref:Uncharacterized protein n=1 Tax=Ixodes persulcatus TaxID=34615 RepID=A0AC60PMF3_IXOPE|nr:hypothetical protein HPB47_002520 [Ixodes persulcatus]
MARPSYAVNRRRGASPAHVSPGGRAFDSHATAHDTPKALPTVTYLLERTHFSRSGTKKKQRDGGRTATGRSRTVKLSPPPPRPLIRPLCRGVYPARESGLNYSRGNYGRKNKKKKRGGEAIARFHFTVDHSESYEPSQPITALGT